MAVFTEEARAKINLTLRVRGRRSDGYHEIESLVAFASTGDAVRLDTSRPCDVETSGSFASDIEGPNLVATALAACAKADPKLVLGHVHIEKRLPVAAGIGGGSADAGAALRAVRRANPELGERVDWSRIAASLGADVPVCFESLPAYMSGVGERIEAVAGLARLDVVLVNPLVAVPPKKTAQVFRLLQAAPMTADCGAERRDVSVRGRAALIDMMRQTGNDLLAPALKVVPAIADVMAALHGTLDVELAQLSGAGPTCFGVYPGRGAANEAAKRLRREYPDWWIEAASIG